VNSFFIIFVYRQDAPGPPTATGGMRGMSSSMTPAARPIRERKPVAWTLSFLAHPVSLSFAHASHLRQPARTLPWRRGQKVQRGVRFVEGLPTLTASSSFIFSSSRSVTNRRSREFSS